MDEIEKYTFEIRDGGGVMETVWYVIGVIALILLIVEVGNDINRNE